MNTYQEKFINMMDEANSKELVEKLYDQCCANCTYRFVCNERACGVTWAKDGAIERLKENDKMLVHLHIVFPEEKHLASLADRESDVGVQKLSFRKSFGSSFAFIHVAILDRIYL